MQTKVSTKGQVVLPGPLRRRLGIRAGDPLEANIEGGRIVLTRPRQVKIAIDPGQSQTKGPAEGPSR